MIERMLDHIGVAVSSLDEAIPIWRALTGGAASARESVPEQGVDVVFLGSGPGRIELLAPTSPTSPVAGFLARRGSGVHHLCYRVPELEAALERHKAEGFTPIDPHPRRGAGGHRVAFLHPRSTGGVLIELLEAR